MILVVNGRECEFDKNTISYEEIVALAGEKGYPTVTYMGPRHGDSRRSGEMHYSCKPVVLEAKMIFSVIHTDNA